LRRQDLREDAAAGVADQDRRRVDGLHDRLEVVDDRRPRDLLDRRRVCVERPDFDLEAGEGRAPSG
jgi:hypothetical protein